MKRMEIIKCHGSGNDFVMVDITRECAWACAEDSMSVDGMAGMSAGMSGNGASRISTEMSERVDWSAFARAVSDRQRGIGSDGLLLVVRHDDGIYGMDMLNPDGTHAEMCGNGIRCVARLASERGYLDRGVLRSGGREYRVARAADVAPTIPAFAVDIPIRLHSRDFAFFAPEERFVGRVIEALDDELCFTALNLGNPHIVAAVEHIDMELLEQLGERVKGLRELFPNGVNVSLYSRCAENAIFVATYERGAGITLSCGTAMTASATAAALLGIVEAGRRVRVDNRGGRVFCTTSLEPDIVTRLEGNATYEWIGEAEFTEGVLRYDITRPTDEAELWREFVASLNR